MTSYNSHWAALCKFRLTIGNDSSCLTTSVNENRNAFFFFSQKTLPLLLESVPDSPYPPTLIITGATASVRGSAQFGSFAAGKFALRALGQSLSREFHPKGVHIAHVIIDGVIDIPIRQQIANGGVEDGKIKPESVSPSIIFKLGRRDI